MKTAILHACLFTPLAGGAWGLPLLIEDEPGTGKTSVVEQYASQWGLPCRVLSPGTDGEGAFGVVPVPQTVGGQFVLTYPAPEWVGAFTNGGVVFCDEVTTAPPILQASMMGLLTARRLGGYKFGPRVRILGAQNPVALAANGYDLAPPLANRFGHLVWGAPSVEEHTAYMLRAGAEQPEPQDALVEEQRVLGRWPVAFASAVGLETAFLAAQQDWKNRCPRPGDPAQGRAWPSDRSWENATRALATADVHELSPTDRDLLVAAFIGTAAAEAFITYLEDAALPNVADVLDGKTAFTHDPQRLDRSAVLVNSAVALLSNAACVRRKERGEVMWGLLDGVGTGALDLIATAVRELMTLNLHTSRAAIRVMAKVEPVLRMGSAK